MSERNDAMSRKSLLAGVIGNFVEYYDFALFGFFATTIAKLFFPQADSTAALLSTFAIFGVGFLARPLGAVVFGHIGDRMGRRPALLLSVGLMSAGTVALGLLPSYAQIGTLAPILLLLCRLVQGFSAGGEYSGVAIFVLEHAPASHRGRYASFGPASVLIGTAFGALVSVAMTSTTTAEQLVSWGWRVPFIAAAPLALIGVYVRMRVEESPAFAALRSEGQTESAPVIEALRVAKKPILIMIGWVMTNAVAFYLVATFLVSYMTTAGTFTMTESLIVQLVAMTVGSAGCIVAGYAIDRIGLKPVGLGSLCGVGMWAIPTFMLIDRGSLLGSCLVIGLFALLYSGIPTTTTLLIVELFPAHVRASASALGYQLAYTVFGGTAPYIATWLVSGGNRLAPGYYLTGLCVASFLVVTTGIGKGVLGNPGYSAMAAPRAGSQQVGTSSASASE